MNPHETAVVIALPVVASLMCLWGWRRERRLRRWAETERDDFEDQLVARARADARQRRTRAARARRAAREAGVTLVARDEATPALEKVRTDVDRLRSPHVTEYPVRPPTSPACEVPSQREGAE